MRSLWHRIWDDEADENGIPTRFGLAWCIKAAPGDMFVTLAFAWIAAALLVALVIPAALVVGLGLLGAALAGPAALTLIVILITPVVPFVLPRMWITEGVIKANGDIDLTGRLHPRRLKDAEAVQYTRFLGQSVLQRMDSGEPFLGRTILPTVTAGAYYRAKVKRALEKLGKSSTIDAKAVQLGLLAAIILGSLFLALAAASGGMTAPPTTGPGF